MLYQIVEVVEDERAFEFMMNQLRLHKSFSLQAFQSSTGLNINKVLPKLKQAKAKQLMQSEIINNDEHWQVTKHGQRYLNDLLELFL